MTTIDIAEQAKAVLGGYLPHHVQALIERFVAEHNPYCPESGRTVDVEYGVSDPDYVTENMVCKHCDQPLAAVPIAGSPDYVIPRHKW